MNLINFIQNNRVIRPEQQQVQGDTNYVLGRNTEALRGAAVIRRCSGTGLQVQCQRPLVVELQ